MRNFFAKLVFIVLLANCFFTTTEAGPFTTAACIAACLPLISVPPAYAICIAACTPTVVFPTP